MRRALLAAILILIGATIYAHPERDTEAAMQLYKQGIANKDNFYYIRAHECYEKALEYLDENKDAALCYEIKVKIAEIYRFYKMYSLERQTLNEAEKIALSSGDTSMISDIYLQQGVRYKDNGEFDKSLELLDKARDVYDGISDGKKAEIESELSIVYMYMNRPKDSKPHIDNAVELTNGDNTFYNDIQTCIDSWLSRSPNVFFDFMKMAGHFNVEKRAKAYRFAYSKMKEAGKDSLALSYLERHVMYRDTLEKDLSKELAERMQTLRDYKRQREHISNVENELETNKLRVHRLMIMILIGMIFFSGLYFYFKRRRSKLEISLLNTQIDYLKEKEEKERAEMNGLKQRIDYYKRLNEMTIPMLMQSRNGMGAIHLNNEDWETVRRNTDACFDNFTERLRKEKPSLTDEEINFCCLVKMGLPMTVLAEVYHIAKGSISRRKMRLKEKMGIDNMTFDEFVYNF